MNAIQQLDRLLLLVSRLQTGEPQRIADLATELGVPEKVILADLKVLVTRDHAEPAGFMESITIAFDSTMVWSERPNHLRRPMALTRQEAMALDLALAMLQSEYPEDDGEMLDGARQKLKGIRLDARAPEDASVAIRIGQMDANAREYRSELVECIALRRLATIAYMKTNDSAPVPREIGPLGFVCVRGVWYLFARNGAQGEVRQYRLDRIHGVESHETVFEHPADFDLQAVLRDGRAFLGDTANRVRIRYRGAAARVVAEDEGGMLDEEGTIVKEYPLANPDWAIRQALRHGANAEILTPAELRRSLVRLLSQI